MSMESFVEQMAVRHRNAVSEFGIPERLIVAEDVKLWRFTGQVDVVFRNESWKWPDIVPVYSGEALIGAATIMPVGETLVASVTATFDLPERLDFENGEPFTLIAEKSYEEFGGMGDPDGVISQDEPPRILTIKKLKLAKCASNAPIEAWNVLE